jgi:MFS family permease
MSGVLLGLTLALVLLPSNIPAAAVPLLRGEWSASSVALGWVVGAYLAGYSFAVLVVLPLTDRVPSRRIIVAGAIVSAVASVALPLVAHDPWTAVVLRVIAGAGLAGVYMPGVRVVAATSAPHRRGLNVGLFVASFYLGSAASFLYAGSLIGEATGWRETMLSSAAISALAIPLALAGAPSIPAAGGRALIDPSVLRVRPLMRTIAAYSGHAWELFAARAWMTAFLASVLVAQGASTADATGEAGRWSAIILAAGIPAVFIGGWISDHLGRAGTALVAALLSGVLAFAFGALGAAPWPLLLAVGFVYSGMVAADSAVYSTTVTELAPAGKLGSAQAIQAFIGFGAGSIGPPAAGLALDLGLGWVAVFGVAGAASIICALPLVLDLSRTRARSGTREPLSG